MTPDLSVVMPAYNEGPNFEQVVPELLAVLDDAGLGACEVIVVNDGSTDDSADVLAKLQASDGRVRPIHLRRNHGKTGALTAGLRSSSGEYVVLMDADGQDDPAAISALLAELDGRLDLVTGRRMNRQDRPVKRVTSKLYNLATARLTGLDGRDFNSGLKAMRREVAADLVLYGELHRYIPVLAHWAGYRVGEVDVNHRPRLHGVSKFGRARFWRGFLDLLTIKIVTTYGARPLHFFGGAGILLGILGSALLGWMLVVKLTGEPIGNRPALLAGILLFIVAVQLFSIGLLGELLLHLQRGRSGDPDPPA